MTAKLNPKLKKFWRTRAHTKVLKGGRASSKTYDAAGIAVYLSSKYTLKFLCMRQFQNRIEDSVYAVLKVRIEGMGLQDEFHILKNSIVHKITGSSFHFYGIHRHINEIKGFEGADIGWIEEAEGLTKEQWKIIEPTLRKEGSEAWLLYNPNLVTDFVETFKHDPENGIIVRHINYTENEFLSSTMLRKIERMKVEDYDEYRHVYLGEPRSDDENVIIKRSWIIAAIDAHIKLGIEPSGSKRVGFDIADSGKDKNSVVCRHGIVNYCLENWSGGEDELLESCTRAYNIAISHNANITYDSIGVGAGAGPKFSELNEQRQTQALSGKVEYQKFVAGGKVSDPDGFYINAGTEQIKNKDFFSNLKSQAWWNTADRFRNTYNAVTKGMQYQESELISISSDINNLEDLVTQLSTPRRRFDAAGKVKVESKDELKSREIDSPNDADAFIMANSPEESNSLGDLLSIMLKGG